MREHSYGPPIITMISAIVLVVYLIMFSSPAEDKAKTAADIITEIAPDDKDKLTEADKTLYSEDAAIIELGYNVAYDEPSYSFGGGILTIRKGGCYVLTGLASQIIVDAGEENPVHLVLHNAAISSQDGPAIYAPSCSKLIITANEESLNTLSDAAVYKVYNGIAKGCIHSRSDITINGSGQLYIQSNKLAGIYSKDDVKIVSGDVEINSIGQGIYGEDKVIIYDGNVTITSALEGIVSTRTGDAEKGCIKLKGGTLNINTPDVAVRGVSEIAIGSCDVNIESASRDYLVSGGDVRIIDDPQ